METKIVYCGDCLQKLKDIPNESVDLIYIDPPFSSKRNYVAFWQEQEKRHFEDRFENVRAYLDYIKPRVEELYRVLKPTGSFYYHCDWHASHYIKMLLDSDRLFGYSNFLNEIIWNYGAKATQRGISFQRKHDTIFLYAKEQGKHLFNPPLQEYGVGSLAERLTRYKHKDEGGVYRLTTRRDKNGNKYRAKVYLKEGVVMTDVWQIPIINPTSKERLGYPTQKPEALLEQIIKASSKEGDIVLDAFCGCGTSLVVAEREKRKWIGIDISPTACRVMAKRLEANFYMKEGRDFWVRDLPKTVEELREYPPFEFQNWAINAIGGVPSRVKVKDGGIDGKLYPVEDIKKEKAEGLDLFGDIDRYIPIQTKRTIQVGRPDIENFEVAMKRDKRNKGIFVGFGFSRDAEVEIRRAARDEGLEIEPITVAQIVEQELDKQLK
jgi:DNA modification methylase